MGDAQVARTLDLLHERKALPLLVEAVLFEPHLTVHQISLFPEDPILFRDLVCLRAEDLVPFLIAALGYPLAVHDA